MGWIISRRARWCAGGGREKRRRRAGCASGQAKDIHWLDWQDRNCRWAGGGGDQPQAGPVLMHACMY